MCHGTWIYLLIFFSPVCVGETLQEIDSVLVVRHHISFHRIKEHVLLWASDPILSELGRGTVMSLMSHLAVEVEMLCSTLLEHTQLESDYRSSMLPAPGTPAPSYSTSSGSILKNGLDRQRRNIFGDILSGITGMPTGEQYRHHMHVQEDLRKKMVSVLKHQLESEGHLTQSISDVQTREEQLEIRLSNLESSLHQQSSATARLFIYYHLLSEDRDMLEDTLDAMRNGVAGVRQDAYLSRLAGLHTLGFFEYNKAVQTKGGVDVEYFARAYRHVELVSRSSMNGSEQVNTGDRRYLIRPHTLPSTPLLLTEDEVNINICYLAFFPFCLLRKFMLLKLLISGKGSGARLSKLR